MMNNLPSQMYSDNQAETINKNCNFGCAAINSHEQQYNYEIGKDDMYVE